MIRTAACTPIECSAQADRALSDHDRPADQRLPGRTTGHKAVGDAETAAVAEAVDRPGRHCAHVAAPVRASAVEADEASQRWLRDHDAEFGEHDSAANRDRGRADYQLLRAALARH